MASRIIGERNRGEEKGRFKVKWLSQCFGISRQAFYKKLKNAEQELRERDHLIEMVKEKRGEISQATGGRKLHGLLKSDMRAREIKMGRDKFFDFLRANSLLVPRLKNYHRTTNSNHNFKKFKNLVKDMVPQGPEELWVSDITYLALNGRHAYLALITDAYSKKIVGFKLSTNMKASLTLDALNMALRNRKYPHKKLIHHSDRGFHYCWPEYVKILEDNEIMISMTEQYDPYENALAERINRTLKYEFGLNQVIANKSLAKKMVKRAVKVYNELRPHNSLNNRTPMEVHMNGNQPYKSYRKNKELKYLNLN